MNFLCFKAPFFIFWPYWEGQFVLNCKMVKFCDRKETVKSNYYNYFLSYRSAGGSYLFMSTLADSLSYHKHTVAILPLMLICILLNTVGSIQVCTRIQALKIYNLKTYADTYIILYIYNIIHTDNNKWDMSWPKNQHP